MTHINPKSAASFGLKVLIMLLMLAFSPSARAQQADSAARLAPLTDQLRLGAEFFLNPLKVNDEPAYHPPLRLILLLVQFVKSQIGERFGEEGEFLGKRHSRQHLVLIGG